MGGPNGQSQFWSPPQAFCGGHKLFIFFHLHLRVKLNLQRVYRPRSITLRKYIVHSPFALLLISLLSKIAVEILTRSRMWFVFLWIFQYTLATDKFQLGYTSDGNCRGEVRHFLSHPQRLNWDIPTEARYHTFCVYSFRVPNLTVKLDIMPHLPPAGTPRTLQNV